MNPSGARDLVVPGALAALDLVARLGLPTAVLALAHERASAAIAAAACTAVASALRGFLLGVATERSLVRAWKSTIEAATLAPPTALEIEGYGGVARLVEAVREAAIYEAQAVPLMASLALALIAVIAAVIVLLGPVWLLLGAAAAAVLGGIVAYGQARLRRASERMWKSFGDAAYDTAVLVEASVELRAHARHRVFADALLGKVASMAREERIGNAWGAVMSLLPASLAVLAAATPARALGGLGLSPGAGSVVDVGVLGGAALVIGMAFARSVEIAVRSAPLRRTLTEFVARGRAAGAASNGDARPLARSLADAEIRFEHVSCVHPGAAWPTPADVDFTWSEARGLAITGANGAGKSTLARALVGLVAPSAGRITIDGVPLAAIDRVSLGRRIAYVPQGAFAAPNASVAWHLRLLVGEPATDARIDAALGKVGLYRVLEEHAARLGKAPRDVLVGELSGGERQRMHLARALLTEAELVILDEPEVGIDDRGRASLRSLLEELAASRRVLVIAHDEAILPASFARLACRRGEPAPGTWPAEERPLPSLPA